MITFATSMWNGEDFEDAIKIATYSGLKVGGTAFIHLFPVAQYFDCIFTPSTTLSAPFLALSSPTIFASCPVSLSNRLLALSAAKPCPCLE